MISEVTEVSKMRRSKGFTIVELIVVMGTAALLMAITVSAFRSMFRGQDTTRCILQLQKIGMAIKAYHLDWGGVPPVYVVEGTMVEPEPLSVLLNGYLFHPQALCCPKDEFGSRISYTGIDENARAVTPLNKYRYMPYRGSDSVCQLSPGWKVEKYGETWAWVPATETLAGKKWFPDDNAIITWCDHHLDETDSKYLVLYWNGEVELLSAGLFDGTHPAAPDEAWQVTPDMEE